MLVRFLTKNEFSYCTDCYQRIFTKNWRQSETVIQTGTGETEEEEEEAGPASGEVMRRGRSDSLQCGHCHSGLWGQSFSWREGQPYCLPCINRLFCKPCQGCPEPIRNDNHQCWSLTMTELVSGSGGGRFVSLDGRYWHTSCFLCTVCSVSLVDAGFIAEAEEIICQDCAEYGAAADQ